METLPQVTIDVVRIRQVFFNLVTNALRHTPAGGEIVVSGVQCSEGVCLAVSDSGEGLEPEQLASVFDRFYRADRSRSRETGGSGLGLAIVKAIVEAHGGRVEARSAGKGCGSTFTVTLHPTKANSSSKLAKYHFTWPCVKATIWASRRSIKTSRLLKISMLAPTSFWAARSKTAIWAARSTHSIAPKCAKNWPRSYPAWTFASHRWPSRFATCRADSANRWPLRDDLLERQDGHHGRADRRIGRDRTAQGSDPGADVVRSRCAGHHSSATTCRTSSPWPIALW